VGLNKIVVLASTNKPLKFLEEALEKHNQEKPEKKIDYYPLITQNDYF
jgi:hypothetical protein